jgi:hypothetical protein
LGVVVLGLFLYGLYGTIFGDDTYAVVTDVRQVPDIGWLLPPLETEGPVYFWRHHDARGRSYSLSGTSSLESIQKFCEAMGFRKGLDMRQLSKPEFLTIRRADGREYNLVFQEGDFYAVGLFGPVGAAYILCAPRTGSFHLRFRVERILPKPTTHTSPPTTTGAP